MRRFAAIALLGLLLGAAAPRPAAPARSRPSAAAPSRQARPSATDPIATIGDRRVEAADIQRAAQLLARDPLRARDPAAWRRMLLDRCIDRELLSMEAQRRGLLSDPKLHAFVTQREMFERRNAIDVKSIEPALRPTPEDLLKARQSKLYRRVDLDCMMLPSTKEVAEDAAERLRSGAPFDSIAHKDSSHPSAANGGHMGWVLVRDLDPRFRDAIKLATPGQIMGPFLDVRVFWIYRVRQTMELPDSSLAETLFEERRGQVDLQYAAGLLRNSHFSIDSTGAQQFIAALAEEPVDSMLASLGPDGTRAHRSGRPPLGILARTDRDAITLVDLAAAGALTPTTRGHVSSVIDVGRLCAAALMPRLVERDAQARGVSEDPELQRRLRLVRDETATVAMVTRAVPAKADSAAMRTFFESHLTRFRRPPAVRMRLATFAARESALAALRQWNGIGASDSAFARRGFTPAGPMRWSAIEPGRWTEGSLLEGSTDSLWLAARALSPGQFAPVVRLGRSYAVVQVTAREESRPLTFEEAQPRLAWEYRAHRENAWVENQLERLRAKIPVRVVPSRLNAVNLDEDGDGVAPSDRRR
jgi:parvulin-like peptidyl-prolyl cis-trans isomerase-like protein/PPIC-type peptidyl-prolyl cis-trans isomerase-like protein